MSRTGSASCLKMCRRQIGGRWQHRHLVRIYERIMDVMRNIQKEEIVPKAEAVGSETELDSEVND